MIDTKANMKLIYPLILMVWSGFSYAHSYSNVPNEIENQRGMEINYVSSHSFSPFYFETYGNDEVIYIPHFIDINKPLEFHFHVNGAGAARFGLDGGDFTNVYFDPRHQRINGKPVSMILRRSEIHIGGVKDYTTKGTIEIRNALSINIKWVVDRYTSCIIYIPALDFTKKISASRHSISDKLKIILSTP